MPSSITSATLLCRELGEEAVLFGDGIEGDRIHVDWGQAINVGVADRTLHLVQ